jgi:hypothetical protein
MLGLGGKRSELTAFIWVNSLLGDQGILLSQHLRGVGQPVVFSWEGSDTCSSSTTYCAIPVRYFHVLTVYLPMFVQFYVMLPFLFLLFFCGTTPNSSYLYYHLGMSFSVFCICSLLFSSLSSASWWGKHALQSQPTVLAHPQTNKSFFLNLFQSWQIFFQSPMLPSSFSFFFLFVCIYFLPLFTCFVEDSCMTLLIHAISDFSKISLAHPKFLRWLP